MLPKETELVLEGSVKRFEQLFGLDTVLYKKVSFYPKYPKFSVTEQVYMLNRINSRCKYL